MIASVIVQIFYMQLTIIDNKAKPE